MKILNSQLTFEKSPHISSRVLGDYLILFDQSVGNKWLFNQASVETWNLMDIYHFLDNLALATAEQNHCQIAEVKEPIKNFLEMLHQRNFIKLYCNGSLVEVKPITTDMNFESSVLFARNNAIENVLIEVTYNCNLRCRHCYINDFHNDLSIKKLQQLLTDLRQMGTIDVTFSGGEIFLRNDILTILQLGIDLGFAVGIITNGTLIIDEIIDKLSQLPLKAIKVSLYSLKSEIHDKITQKKGSLERTLAAIHKLVATGQRVIVSTIIQKETAFELPEIKKFAEEAGCLFEADYKLYPRHDGNTDPLNYYIGEEAMVYLYQTKIIPPPKELRCGAGESRIKINPQGEVFICEFIHDSLGNIHQHSIKNIWQSQKLKDVKKYLTTYNPLECQDCSFKSYCCRCPGLVWNNPLPNIHHPLMCQQAKAFHKSQEKTRQVASDVS